MVRGRGDQGHARHGMADLRHEIVDLVSGELTAFTGLCALRHLDLDIFRIPEIADRNTETAARHLFDRTVEFGPEPFGIFAAFAAVAHRAAAVHRLRDRGMGFRTQTAETHCARNEMFQNAFNTFNFFQRNALCLLETEESAQCAEMMRLMIDQTAVFLEFGVIALLDCLTERRK